jgi:hypothetical protein
MRAKGRAALPQMWFIALKRFVRRKLCVSNIEYRFGVAQSVGCVRV